LHIEKGIAGRWTGQADFEDVVLGNGGHKHILSRRCA
jgi:hypothetical protein